MQDLLSPRPLSPLANIGLEGYASEISVKPTDTLSFMLSGPPGTATLHAARLLHGDPAESGPGYRATTMDWELPRSVRLSYQQTDFGSYVEVIPPLAARLNPSHSFTLSLWFLPTALNGWQALATKLQTSDVGYGLFCCGPDAIAAVVSHDGTTAHWCSGRMRTAHDRWQFAAMIYDAAKGEIHVCQSYDHSPLDIALTSKVIPAGNLHASAAPFLLGAMEDIGVPRHYCHFNGKISDLRIFDTALPVDDLRQLALGSLDVSSESTLMAWDFSDAVGTDRVVDRSGKATDGRVVNAPARAVTGPSWQVGHSQLYTDNPHRYDAIHLHEDDLDDSAWKPSFELQVPADARSGLYACVVETRTERIFIPFVVSPKAPESALAILFPTLTWQAYSSNQLIWANTEDGVLDRGPCLYHRHTDGSPVYYCTRRKPTRAWDPTSGFRLWGAHLLTANLYLVDWLERKSFKWDAISDQDLDRDGIEMLRQYKCLLISGHPEYWTEHMMRTAEQYIEGGGRIMYLAGNGLYWVTSIDPYRPHLMEVRKSAEGDAEPGTIALPGEVQHSTTLEQGGLWSRRGVPPRSILGVEYSATSFGHSDQNRGFKRTSLSYDDPYSFVFEGVEDETIGEFGLNLDSAVGYELDSAQDATRHHAVAVLARASDGLNPPSVAPASPIADMTLLCRPGGGAVFSAGSVTWTGSLSHNNYSNNVSAVTENVLRRFLSVPHGESVLHDSSAT